MLGDGIDVEAGEGSAALVAEEVVAVPSLIPNWGNIRRLFHEIHPTPIHSLASGVKVRPSVCVQGKSVNKFQEYAAPGGLPSLLRHH